MIVRWFLFVILVLLIVRLDKGSVENLWKEVHVTYYRLGATMAVGAVYFIRICDRNYA